MSDEAKACEAPRVKLPATVQAAYARTEQMEVSVTVMLLDASHLIAYLHSKKRRRR